MMNVGNRHYINEGLYLIRFFIEPEKENALTLDDCYYLLKDEIITAGEIKFDILDFVVTKEVVYTETQYGYAGQNSTLGVAQVTHIGCNRYPDYFSVEGINELLDNTWEVAFIQTNPTVRRQYLNSEYVCRYMNRYGELFKELIDRILQELEKKKTHTNLAIFM